MNNIAGLLNKVGSIQFNLKTVTAQESCQVNVNESGIIYYKDINNKLFAL